MSVISPDLPSNLSVENMPIFRHHVDVLCSFRIFPSCETFAPRRFVEKKEMNMWHLKYSAITLVTIKIFYYRWWIVLVNWKRSFQIYLNWNVRSKLWNPLNMTICYRIHEYVCYSCESDGKMEQGVPFMSNVISVGVQHKILTCNDEAAGVIMEFWHGNYKRETEDYGGCSNPLCKIQFPAFLGEFIYSFNFSTSDETPA